MKKLNLLLSAFILTHSSFSSACALFKNHIAQSETEEELLMTPIDPIKTETAFYQITERIVDLYTDKAREVGRRLTYRANWESLEENAYADKGLLSWKITMFGGLFRHKDITLDGYALITCHEIGHHLAGVPYADTSTDMASEGQSDYWGSAVCLRKYFKEYPLQEPVELEDEGRERCDQEWDTTEDREICYRTYNAGKSLAMFLRGSIKPFKFADFMQASVARSSFGDHPTSSCRFQTYLAGALCKIDDPDSLTKSLYKDKLTTTLRCKDDSGELVDKRPTCWYNPYVNFSPRNNSPFYIHSTNIFKKEKTGKITFRFFNHLPGNYKFILEADPATDTEQFVTIINGERELKVKPASQKTVKFKFKFKNKIDEAKLKFKIKVEYDNKVIYHEKVGIEVVGRG